MLTRRADAPPSEGVSWVSDGQGEYRVEAVERAERGTTVSLKLKADADEFLRPERLRELIRKYSDHIAFPVRLSAGTSTSRTVSLVKREVGTVTLSEASTAPPPSRSGTAAAHTPSRHSSRFRAQPARLTWASSRVRAPRSVTVAPV